MLCRQMVYLITGTVKYRSTKNSHRYCLYLTKSMLCMHALHVGVLTKLRLPQSANKALTNAGFAPDLPTSSPRIHPQQSSRFGSFGFMLIITPSDRLSQQLHPSVYCDATSHLCSVYGVAALPLHPALSIATHSIWAMQTLQGYMTFWSSLSQSGSGTASLKLLA